MSRSGPAQLTLGEIAATAGVTPAALVQRFGSKRGLLLALAEIGADAPTAMFRELRAAHESPLSALREYARCMAGMGRTPRALAHNLAYLQIDLTDPDFNRHTRAMAVATGQALRDLLDAAALAGELTAETDTALLARLVQAIISGSLISWALYREGAAEDWVLADLESVLRPHSCPAEAEDAHPSLAHVKRRGRSRSGARKSARFPKTRPSKKSRHRPKAE
jgi:AcrR family transcriptional regulator